MKIIITKNKRLYLHIILLLITFLIGRNLFDCAFTNCVRRNHFVSLAFGEGGDCCDCRDNSGASTQRKQLQILFDRILYLTVAVNVFGAGTGFAFAASSVTSLVLAPHTDATAISLANGGGGGGGGSVGGGSGNQRQPPQLSPLSSVGVTASGDRPFFDEVQPRNVTAVVDEMTTLKCRVKNRGDRTVSWMRKQDLHILTSNIYPYTGDQRFSVTHLPDSDNWDLRIEYVQLKDSGIYECQVNTEPKINYPIWLSVTADHSSDGGHRNKIIINGTEVRAARAKINGVQEVFVKKGSTISLSCLVNVHVTAVAWFHGTSLVDFDSARGGISLETEKTDTGTTSRLMLTRAVLRDSGNYTCLPVGAISASVQVHVLHGEHPAAMQTSCGGPSPPSHTALFVIVIVTAAIRSHTSFNTIISDLAVFDFIMRQSGRSVNAFNNCVGAIFR